MRDDLDERHAIAAADVGDDQLEILARAGARGTNLLGTVKRNEPLFEVWKPFSRHFTLASDLDAKLRELLILRVACVAESNYEWGNHVMVARSLGMTDTEIARVRDDPNADTWAPVERILLRLPDDFREYGVVPTLRWNHLAQHFSEATLVEILLLIGHYFALGFLARSASVAPETGLPSLEVPPTSSANSQ